MCEILVKVDLPRYLHGENIIFKEFFFGVTYRYSTRVDLVLRLSIVSGTLGTAVCTRSTRLEDMIQL